MTPDTIAAVGAAGLSPASRLEAIQADLPPEFAPKAAAPATGFATMVTQGIEAVNQQLMVSQTDLQALATGDAQNLHQIMMRLEESRLSFQLLMQVRGRLLEAYQDVMKMQV